MQFTLQLQQSFEALFQEPQRFNQLSKQAIVELAKIHNSHNRLLPSEVVADIIEQLYVINPFENRKSSLKFAFYYNILRLVVLSNFHQLKDNKVFAVIAMIYAEKLSQFYHELESQQKSLAIIRHIAQMAVINEITIKYIQKTKVFFPEFIRALKISIEKLQHSISRNLRHISKTEGDSNQFCTTEAIMKIAFSKDTQKSELIYILVGLLNYILKQASTFFTSTSNKKEILQLTEVESIILKLQQLQTKLPSQIGSQIVLPAEFKKYEGKQGEQNLNKENQPIFLQQPIAFRELTPRFYDEEEATVNKMLRKKKNKMEKKMHLQLQQSTHQRLQQKRVVQNVRQGKINQRFKKETFILQKQTEEAKKSFKQMKKVKNIKKESKLGRKGKKK